MRCGKQLNGGFNCSLPSAYLDKRGYAVFEISQSPVNRDLKRSLGEINLPLLQRKWAKIDDNLINKYEKAESRRKEVIALLSQGVRKSEIAQRLGVSPSAITMMIQRHKLAA